MLLSAVIIILREVLELALLTSILLAVGNQLKLTHRWFIYAVCSGLAGAFLYGVNTAKVSEWFDYTGQEIVNGTAQIIIFTSIAVLIFIKQYRQKLAENLAPLFMAVSVALLVTREGSEIYIYISGFAMQTELLPAILAGSAIGGAIGLSIGALFYYVLSYKEDVLRDNLGMAFLAVIASGVLSQAVPMFMQADLIEAQSPLWDSSKILPEQSLPGQLLYAVAGYEASPGAFQFLTHIMGLILMLGLAFMPQMKRVKGREDDK